MSTRSRIAYLEKDGSYMSIYCHFDGCTVINQLKNYHKTEKAARSIVGGGNVSFILRERVEHYTLRGESFESNTPIYSGSLIALIEICHLSSGEYLNLFELGEWKQIKIS